MTTLTKEDYEKLFALVEIEINELADALDEWDEPDKELEKDFNHYIAIRNKIELILLNF